MPRTATPKNVRSTKTGATVVSQSDVALRAFEYYCARGGQPGNELDDWLRAERELMGGMFEPKRRRSRKQSGEGVTTQ